MKTKLDRATVKTLIEVTDVILDNDLNLTTQQLKAFLLICLEEGMSAGRLQDKTDFPKATASRILRNLSPKESPTRDGLDLVTLVHDENDYRIRRAYLNNNGEKLLVGLQSTAIAC